MGIRLLAIEKSIGAVFFLLAAVVLLVLYARNVTHPLQRLFAQELREDPHDVIANLLIGLFPEVSRTALLTLALIASGYMALHVVEAAGLWLGWLWLEYFILIETAALVPFEIYEMFQRPTVFKAAILVVNLVVVWYLARRRLRFG